MGAEPCGIGVDAVLFTARGQLAVSSGCGERSRCVARLHDTAEAGAAVAVVCILQDHWHANAKMSPLSLTTVMTLSSCCSHTRGCCACLRLLARAAAVLACGLRRGCYPTPTPRPFTLACSSSCPSPRTRQVVVTDATLAAVEAARAQGRSLWRVSSTVFSHVASDALLRPLGHFATPSACAQYPAMPAGQQVGAGLRLAGFLSCLSPFRDSAPSVRCCVCFLSRTVDHIRH